MQHHLELELVEPIDEGDEVIAAQLGMALQHLPYAEELVKKGNHVERLVAFVCCFLRLCLCGTERSVVPPVFSKW